MLNLNQIKNAFNNLQSQSVMDRNITTASDLNTMLNQETQATITYQTQYQAQYQTQRDNSIANLQRANLEKIRLENLQTERSAQLGNNQEKAQEINSYFTDFANNEFTEVDITGDFNDVIHN